MWPSGQSGPTLPVIKQINPSKWTLTVPIVHYSPKYTQTDNLWEGSITTSSRPTRGLNGNEHKREWSPKTELFKIVQSYFHVWRLSVSFHQVLMTFCAANVQLISIFSIEALGLHKVSLFLLVFLRWSEHWEKLVQSSVNSLEGNDVWYCHPSHLGH